MQNIVAARDGLITKIEALDGVTCAAVGETVQAGQVLLSGVADSPRGCRYMRATGRIWARTWYEWTVPVPLETVLKDGTEPVKTRTHTALGFAYLEACADKSAALRREIALKKLTKAQKEALCAGWTAEKE